MAKAKAKKEEVKDTTLSKAELVDRVAEVTEMKKKDVKLIIDSTLDTMSNSLSEGVKVQLTGFGTFEVRQRQERQGVRPGTTEKITIPASKYPAFKAGKALKDAVKSS